MKAAVCPTLLRGEWTRLSFALFLWCIMRFKLSYLWAFLIALAVAGWMVSGQFGAPDDAANDAADNSQAGQVAADAPSAMDSQMLVIKAIKVANAPVDITLRASGVMQSAFDMQIVSRRQAEVQEILVQEGSWVKEGDLLVRLSTGTLRSDITALRAERQAASAGYIDAKKRFSTSGTLASQLTAAEANLAAVKQNFEATQKLNAQKLRSNLDLSNARAELKAAQNRLFELQNLSSDLEISNAYSSLTAVDARLAQLEEQLSFTEIRAPQDGWLEEVLIEKGEIIQNSQPLARLIGLQTLKLSVPVPQARIGEIAMGDRAEVSVIGAGLHQGKVVQIASTANAATRTFDVEIMLDNKAMTLRAGMSAEAAIEIGQAQAFKISPAHLNVDENGRLSAKIVGADERVQSRPVELVRTDGNFAYVSGLADGQILLAAGQAFLRDGASVRYELDEGQE